jgi:hypothetical protein
VSPAIAGWYDFPLASDVSWRGGSPVKSGAVKRKRNTICAWWGLVNNVNNFNATNGSTGFRQPLPLKSVVNVLVSVQFSSVQGSSGLSHPLRPIFITDYVLYCTLVLALTVDSYSENGGQ